jgi:hypothetical protein
MPKGKKEGAEVWSDRVRRWKDSGLSSKAFAEREGIARPQSLSWWAWHLAKGPAVASARPKKPRELRLVRFERADLGSPACAEPVEIVTTSGARIVVSSRADEEALRRALSALGVRS